jgi:hypothetical protein
MPGWATCSTERRTLHGLLKRPGPKRAAHRSAGECALRFRRQPAKFADVIVDVTLNAGGLGSITVDLVGLDPASGKEYLILSSGALTAVATKTLQIGPGLPVAANATQNQDVPAKFRVKVTHNNANPITYSVGLNLQ